MGLAYVVNREGRRVIRWPALGLFCIAASVVPPAIAAVASVALAGDLRLVGLAVPMGLLIAAGAVGRSLGTPVDRLPKDA